MPVTLPPLRYVAPFALLAMPVTGCTGIPLTDESSGTTHRIIIGIGVVSAPAPTARADITAARMNAFGLSADSGPAGGVTLGYRSAAVVVAAREADAGVAITGEAFGPMTVTHSPATTHDNP